MKTEIINYDIDGKDFLGYAAFPDGENFPVSSLPGVDKSKIAVFGYCFGGLVSLDLARTGVDLRGSASFHGFLAGPEEPTKETIKAKILAMHGMKDPMVGEDQMQSFYKEMSEKDVDWQLHIYGDSMHSFTNPEANNPDFGTVYSKEADRRSWMLLMDFLLKDTK